MIINLLKLKLNQERKITINETVNIDKDYYKNTDIKNIGDIKLNGNILYHGEEFFELALHIKCDITLSCSITLEDVILPIDININENLGVDEEENNKIVNNSIDLIPIIWQNIILEVPLKVISPNVDRSKLQGNGWKLVTEEEELEKEDPRLEKLKDFLSDKERS